MSAEWYALFVRSQLLRPHTIELEALYYTPAREDTDRNTRG